MQTASTTVRRTPAAAARATATILAAAAGSLFPTTAHADLDNNVARYRFANATPNIDQAVGPFITDGKIGPENRWVSIVGGSPRFTIAFERPTRVGSFHLYSGGDRDDPVDTLTVQYVDADGTIGSLPDASFSGNTDWFVNVTLNEPVEVVQLLFTANNPKATVQEVAVFPPGAEPFPAGTGVNMHLARQHRVALTPASSTAPGSTRRAVVDGFVNDADHWLPAGGTSHWIELDISDPPETVPVSVRTTTTPVEIGAVHIYSGLDSGAPAATAGAVQFLDNDVWTDIPGGSFAGNTDRELELVFDAPITTDRLRIAFDGPPAPIREIVPLPAPIDAGWPLGTSVIRAAAPDVADYDDDFHTVSLDTGNLALAALADGSLELRDAAPDFIGQHFQVLLNVGTDTYRLRSRVSGRCLEPANASDDPLAPVIETEYLGFPTQRWRLEPVAGGVRIVNAATGLALTASAATEGSSLVQHLPGLANQTWTLTAREHAPKKGNGGFPQLSETFDISWAYNWGPEDAYAPEVDFWPMQWGSFNWSQRPSLLPIWKRNAEPIVLMGYNEPDKADQANMPVQTGIDMWPRLEAMNMPLLGPAPAGHPVTHPWIQDFMQGVDDREMRVDYVGIHHYAGTNPDGLINKINDAWTTWNRPAVVSEFSVVDWQNTNSWTIDPVYNFFAEVLWRMEDFPHLHRYAVFVFTDDPADPISDNRGEMLNADGTLTPEGRLYAAFDGDTKLRTDTAYHIHHKASFDRLGAVAGQSGPASITLGDRTDEHDPFRWHLVPTDTADVYRITPVNDDRTLLVNAQGFQLVQPVGTPGEFFRIVEIQHGWFAIEDTIFNRRIGLSGGAVSLLPPGDTSDQARWRFAPVHLAPPAPPREGSATDTGNGTVELAWAEHGFRDLIAFSIQRTGPGINDLTTIADVTGFAFTDAVPGPGTYTYTVSALGDTGESDPAPLGTVTVNTCPADFNGDFTANDADITEAIIAVEAGTDLNADNAADFFDILWFLDLFDGGCTQ